MAAQAALRRVSSFVGAEIMGRREKAGDDFAGIAYPYFLPTDTRSARRLRLRLDNPGYEEKNDKVKEKYKYLSARGAQNCFYFTPNAKPEFLKDTNLSVVFFEGEKKALAGERVATENYTLDSWHFLPVALAGVWGFRTGNINKITTPNGQKASVSGNIPDFGLISLKGRTAIICFDPNTRTNPDVAAARFGLASVLKQKGARVFFAEMPEDCAENFDDYLGREEMENGVESAIEKGLEIIRRARPFEKIKVAESSNFKLIAEGEKPGVYFVDENSGEKTWICSPLEVVAETQTETGENYGRLLRWSDSKERLKTWAMPLELVHSDSFELVKYLVNRGLLIGTSRTHHDRLKNYINLSQPEETIICTAKIGWHNGVYVFPDESIGASENRIVYQPEYAAAHKYVVRGTLEEWRENISQHCIGNSRLAFGVSIAFASVLLPIIDVQSGGFHYRGSTSSGKSTAGFVAGSVFGGSDDELGFAESWKTTANGLESVAEMHNHSFLPLDELAQIDARQAGDVAYMLGNGAGKRRMTKTVTARRSLSWQLLFLSNGEISLADKMKEAGLTIRGGQAVRCLDIPADICKFGVFDNLHGFPNGQSFADYLRSTARKFYGTASREYLRGLVEKSAEDIRAAWHTFQERFIAKLLPESKQYPQEVFRAAKRFALVAFAGEMASSLGVTGWQAKEAINAAEIIFRAWFDNRAGRGSSDAERAISQIRAFIEAHGTSRFEMLTASDESLDTSRINNRAGFRKVNDAGEMEYLFLPEIFRSEVCRGFDYKFVCKILDERRLLRHDPAGFQKQLKYGGVQIRPYWVSSKIMEDADGQAETKVQEVSYAAK
jgi:putative DNA primase/helicase